MQTMTPDELVSYEKAAKAIGVKVPAIYAAVHRDRLHPISIPGHGKKLRLGEVLQYKHKGKAYSPTQTKIEPTGVSPINAQAVVEVAKIAGEFFTNALNLMAVNKATSENPQLQVVG